jgi:hypothetical protein
LNFPYLEETGPQALRALLDPAAESLATAPEANASTATTAINRDAIGPIYMTDAE